MNTRPPGKLNVIQPLSKAKRSELSESGQARAGHPVDPVDNVVKAQELKKTPETKGKEKVRSSQETSSDMTRKTKKARKKRPVEQVDPSGTTPRVKISKHQQTEKVLAQPLTANMEELKFQGGEEMQRLMDIVIPSKSFRKDRINKDDLGSMEDLPETSKVTGERKNEQAYKKKSQQGNHMVDTDEHEMIPVDEQEGEMDRKVDHRMPQKGNMNGEMHEEHLVSRKRDQADAEKKGGKHRIDGVTGGKEQSVGTAEDFGEEGDWQLAQTPSSITKAPKVLPKPEEAVRRRAELERTNDVKLTQDQDRYKAYKGPFSHEEKMREAGIERRLGRFSVQEDERIHRAIEAYLEDQDLDETYAFLLTNKFRSTNARHHGKFSDFWRTILYEIPDRMYGDAVRHIKRMMHPGNRHGKTVWTAEEDQQLLE